jgi:hypothetical protein
MKISEHFADKKSRESEDSEDDKAWSGRVAVRHLERRVW